MGNNIHSELKLLRDLHWLLVPDRIQFRLCILAFRCLNGSAPPYLIDSVHWKADVEGHRYLRSSTTMMLVVQYPCSSYSCSDHSKTSYVGGCHNMPLPLQVNLLSGVRVTCYVAYICANYNLSRPLCSRLRPDVRNRQTSDAHHRLMPPTLGAGHNNALSYPLSLLVLVVTWA